MTTEVTTAPADESQALVQQTAIKALDSKKLTFAEVMATLGNPFEVEATETSTEIHVPEITAEQRQALIKISQVYGVVQPETRRMLSDAELSALMEERQIIDTILALIEPRKSNSIRETVANHFDLLAETKGLVTDETPRDAKGHYAIKMEAPAPGTGMEWQRIVQNNKPTLTSAAIEKLHLDGHLTREEYLSITKTPEVKRVFDEDKARAAIKKNPALMFKIAQAAVPGTKTTVIKTGKDEG